MPLSALWRAIPLCFAFDRVNYKRWLPVYYEDCLALPNQCPDIYNAFSGGDFVVRHTTRRCSADPMDQALEKTYNKPAKCQSGIIGISRRKNAVCKWSIIKHEKAKYTEFLEGLCLLNEDGEYSLHHEYSQTITEVDEQCVSQIVVFLLRGNPFDTSYCTTLINVVTNANIEK